MIEVRQTLSFQSWLESLEDRRAQSYIARRLGRLELGLFGDTKSVGDGVTEVRLDYGPRYRLYFTRRDRTVVLLCGGDKGSQSRDIKLAKSLVLQL